MSGVNLIDGEQNVLTSKNGTVTLTNYRIRYQSLGSGKKNVVSILLEKISAIEVRYKSYPMLLFIGILSGAVGILSGLNNQGDIMSTGVLLSIVLIILFLLTRKHIIAISSDSGVSIDVLLEGMKHSDAIYFLDQIEKTKQEKVALFLNKE